MSRAVAHGRASPRSGMERINLDDIDRGILHLLQQDARRLTPVDIAKQLPVSDGTVRNRIERMEREEIITGYVPVLDYEVAGFPLQVLYTCTSPITERSERAEQTLQISGVVEVMEKVAPRENVLVVGIALDTDDISRIGTALHRMDDLELESEELLRDMHIQPFDHFGKDVAEPE